MTKTSNENQTYDEFAAKRKLLQMKYDEKLTLETNLKDFSKRTHVLHSPEATEFLHQTANHALRLERMIYSFMGGEHQASIDVVLGGSGVIAIDGKHDDDMEEAAIAMGKELLSINGTQHQMGQLGCELSELSIALYQHYQQGSKSIDVVANELADLLNMLPQLILVMEEQGVMDLVRSYQKMKLERIRHRTKQKMQEGNYAD